MKELQYCTGIVLDLQCTCLSMSCGMLLNKRKNMTVIVQLPVAVQITGGLPIHMKLCGSGSAMY